MSDSRFVTLTGGLIVPLAALQALLALEDRGLRFTLDGDDIVAHPRQLLTDEDRQMIRSWRPHIVALIAYCHQEPVQ